MMASKSRTNGEKTKEREGNALRNGGYLVHENNPSREDRPNVQARISCSIAKGIAI